MLLLMLLLDVYLTIQKQPDQVYFPLLIKLNYVVNVGGFEPPLTEPKSVVLPLHHTSGCPTAVRLINLSYNLNEKINLVLWAGLEPA